ncbi:hypothetical protein GCM10010399_23020 [Dactylosporangium fulvum]|uniref:Restriction endonuclease type IV Mrr domain-containing protein n=1 Tax=Dactylosporangium fulvum TaxID=53359 RepID=A0ABY5VYG4_9ACTN|nr:hypothetical protein [Dactylosporangium fulvum]UWP82209.1 hypothetical protein Dfulv_45305 [Dactylosporangium fulvum]
MTMVAGTVDLPTIMTELQRVRPVFHSEADFQHAFAWAVHQLDPLVNVRLEVRQGSNEYLDVLCFGAHGTTAIELKYFTAAWEGSEPSTEEHFEIRGHAATDLARHGFVNDIARLERFCGRHGAMTGLAIMLTNDRSLWKAPSGRQTRDGQFRIHEGGTLAGALRWGIEPDFFAPNERILAGSYTLRWNDYSNLPGRNGEFQWLAASIAASGAAVT